MKVSLTVTVPKPVYDIYSKVAEQADRTIERVMSEALEDYIYSIIEKSKQNNS